MASRLPQAMGLPSATNRDVTMRAAEPAEVMLFDLA